MRKLILSLAAAGAAVLAASPAAAQYYPQPRPGYGYHGNWGEVRALQERINGIRSQIARLDRRDAIRGRTANRLLNEANRIDRKLHQRARRGLDPREAGDIQYRIQRLEQQVHYALADRGHGWRRW